MMSGQSLEAYYDIKKFNVPGDQPFVDVHLSFIGNSVAYDQDGIATVESTILIKQGNHIVDAKKSLIKSPPYDSLKRIDFIDMQRFSLKNGKYSLTIFLRDLNHRPNDTIKVVQPFELLFSGNKMEFSDVELADNFKKITSSDPTQKDIYTRAGYRIVPYVSNYYPTEINYISFYAEIYHADLQLGKDKKFVTYLQITDEGKNVIDPFQKTIVHTTSAVNVVLGRFKIDELYSGTYLINLKIKDENNTDITETSIRFYRNNAPPISNYASTDTLLAPDLLFTQMISNRDTLVDFIRSMRPRAELLERTIIDEQIASASTDELQQFMYTFWLKRDPQNPQGAWDDYYDLVKIVNDEYSTQLKRGYQTDRGRVFLQYGKPNQLRDVPSEPNAYPYQIWYYYHIGRFNNKRFVFYNRDLSSNDYMLLHSDMNGEPYNRQWNIELHSRTNPINDIDLNDGIDNVGSRSRDYYNDPR